MEDLTAYFLTTDRVNAEESLASVRAQGLVHPIVVVRNLRPLRAAHLPTLQCATDYCLVLDDDTVLRPGIAATLLERFHAMRQEQPQAYRLSAMIFAEALQSWATGGLKLYYVPHLRRVGWPDVPHISPVQADIAAKLGLLAVKCEIEAGVERRGTNLDLYKKYLWI